ncbi:hypothetical protein EON65_25025 [archaeon]|nr:MAG: hypothetical protein EON65_25025 [archaeon]
MGLAQKFQVNKDSSGNLPRPASVAAMTSNYNSLVNGPAAATHTSSTTATASDNVLSPDPADAKPEAKNPNSVVNKLLGKYNRKSFISTARPSLVVLTSSETEESKGSTNTTSAPESQPEAPSIQNNVPSFSNTAKVETKHSTTHSMHSMSMPVMGHLVSNSHSGHTADHQHANVG